MQRLTETFSTTLEGLDSGLVVGQIATRRFKTCDASEPVELVLRRPALLDFDQIPVKAEGNLVGVLERDRLNAGSTVSDAMRRLTDAMLVSATQPLGPFLNEMAISEYRLVVDGRTVDAIVTGSDMIKLPVRVYAFTLITHLELVMAAQIRRAFRGNCADDWIDLLSEGRRTKVRDKHAKLSAQRINPSLIEFTDFCDKVTVLRRHHGLGRSFERELAEIQEFRDRIAHADVFAEDSDSLTRFVTALSNARRWSEDLPKKRADGGGAFQTRPGRQQATVTAP